MTTHFLPIQFAEEELHLLPDRAIYWPARAALIVTDLHLGKAAGFRSLGIPVPKGSTAKDLARLSKLIETHQAKRLIILGDFYHSRRGVHDGLVEAISAWRMTLDAVHVRLIRGNHDRAAGRTKAEWNFEEVDGVFDEAPFSFSHMDCHTGQYPTLCGHVHPVVSVKDFDGSLVRIPCFVVEQNRLILPSFGTFTGGYAIESSPDRKIFLVTGRSVVTRAAK